MEPNESAKVPTTTLATTIANIEASALTIDFAALAISLQPKQDEDVTKIRQLTKKEMNKIPMDPLADKLYFCKLYDVYDGDTFTVVIHVNGELRKIRCRAMGYNSPEIKVSKSNPLRDEIKKYALQDKDLAEKFFKDCDVLVYLCEEKDRYGRHLSKFYKFPLNHIASSDMSLYENECCSKNSLRKYMLANGNAEKYYGGKKNVAGNKFAE
jgi:endonuclease YncB( thermonuclease family)